MLNQHRLTITLSLYAAANHMTINVIDATAAVEIQSLAVDVVKVKVIFQNLYPATIPYVITGKLLMSTVIRLTVDGAMVQANSYFVNRVQAVKAREPLPVLNVMDEEPFQVIKSKIAYPNTFNGFHDVEAVVVFCWARHKQYFCAVR